MGAFFFGSASKRRFAAVLAADTVGYNRLMGADEDAQLAKLRISRRGIE
jgi:hypothetical protein